MIFVTQRNIRICWCFDIFCDNQPKTKTPQRRDAETLRKSKGRENHAFVTLSKRLNSKARDKENRTYAKQTLAREESRIDLKNSWRKLGCAMRTVAANEYGAHGSPYVIKL